VSGLELAGGSSAACRDAAVLQLDAGSLRFTPRSPTAGLPAGGAFFTVESSCAQPSLLSLELSRDSAAVQGGSVPSRLNRQLAAGAGHRKLLQGQQAEQMPAAQGGNRSVSAGVPPAAEDDKTTPLQPVLTDNRTASPSPAPSPPPGPEQACCCRYVTGVLPYDPQTVGVCDLRPLRGH
jgi:hypothetical protein